MFLVSDAYLAARRIHTIAFIIGVGRHFADSIRARKKRTSSLVCNSAQLLIKFCLDAGIKSLMCYLRRATIFPTKIITQFNQSCHAPCRVGQVRFDLMYCMHKRMRKNSKRSRGSNTNCTRNIIDSNIFFSRKIGYATTNKKHHHQLV